MGKINDTLGDYIATLGVTILVGSGMAHCQRNGGKEYDKETFEKEWRMENPDADTIVVDYGVEGPETASCFAAKFADKSIVDSLRNNISSVKNKSNELLTAQKSITNAYNQQLFFAAKSGNVEKYKLIKNKMLKNGITINYDAPNNSGISLNDLLRSNANSHDVRWMSINRRHEQAKDIDDFELKDNGNGSFNIVYHSEEAATNEKDKNNETIVLTDFLKQKPSKNIQDLNKQIKISQKLVKLFENKIEKNIIESVRVSKYGNVTIF